MAGHGDKGLGKTIAAIETRSKYAVSQVKKNSEYILATKLFLLKRIDSLEKEIAEMKVLINHHIERNKTST